MSTYQKNKLEVKNIEKSFDNNLIVKDLSFYVGENEFVSLLGPSGCGKSTIFNIIAGLLRAEEGKVTMDGEDYTGKVGRVSYMHQKDLLLPWKKVIDNAAIPLVVRGKKKNEARKEVEKYFHTFGLEGFEYNYPFQLSGGMRQRVALLRTYMFSKDIMLLDEPFGALDAITRSKMHYWLLNVVKELNTTILFITHDIEEAILLSDRIYVLSDKPATIKEEIVVDLPSQRKKDIVTSSKFNEIKRKIINAL
ncbi:ABC transporter ATP-binding protein [Clostridium niameyense]|uniref:ABC transporter ATP-binding protein n=1 Tax=Clostridium niameyense TaxID=1622073 RepID=A0A6M0R6C5_9CLOT|nr:ABC transporter ATP-binding protein [Clostridium niameyense]NEZ45744.1 ABC transporter ATP-binding protein [Clostridium niameyense]